MATIENKTPTITWVYSDPNLQPQEAFRVIVTRSPDYSEEILWDTGEVESDQTEVVYNYDGNGKPLPSHETLRLTVWAYDGLDWGYSTIKEFEVSARPVIELCTVDNKVNPSNLINQTPLFRWKYTDVDEDPLVAYEIRVSDDQTNWGTDGFAGVVWHPGVQTLPNPHEAQFNEDGMAFHGCYFPKELEEGVTYYFQLQVYDKYAKSEWYTGFFKLNTAPQATDLAILPVDPSNGDDLEAVYTFVDDAGETESDKTQIRWYRNSREYVALRNTKTVPGSTTRPGQSWYFTVTPHDGVEFGQTYVSPRVVVTNVAPKVTAASIIPSLPKSSDQLETNFFVSDYDKDEVVVSIAWFKNGIEQPSLRNSRVVPPGYGAVGDEFYFQVQADDGYEKSTVTKSNTVTIQNTKPSLRYIFVDNEPLPTNVTTQAPSIWWKYDDVDRQEQEAYHVLIGTTPPIALTSNDVTYASSSARSSGVIAVMKKLRDGTGNDILDTNAVYSNDNYYVRSFVDSRQAMSLGASQSVRYSGYYLDKDLQTTKLQPQTATGEATFDFQGETGIYEVFLEYVDESRKKSTYRLSVDGSTVDQFVSEGLGGVKQRSFAQTKIQKGALVSIIGSPAENNGVAPFQRLICKPVLSFEYLATQMQLAGYVDAGDGTIRVVGSDGVAQLSFPYTGGKYDIEVYYLTESSGQPQVSLQVNGTTVYSWTYEEGLQRRVKTVRDVSLETGDIVKLVGTKDESASAKIEKMIFLPSQTGGLAELRNGRTYYASVRVSDGHAWSDWYVTRFVMDGSAWYSDVSNENGWTIEFVARLMES